MGTQTVLLSFNRHVGGMTSGGLTATDVGKKESIGGLAREFYDRIGMIKGFSPSQAEATFLQMLKEAGVTVPCDTSRAIITPHGYRFHKVSLENFLREGRAETRKDLDSSSSKATVVTIVDRYPALASITRTPRWGEY